MSEPTNMARERMYTCVSDVGRQEGLPAEEEVPTDLDVDTSGVRSMLGGDAPQVAEINIQSANNEDEDEEDEVFSSEKENENEMESQERRTVKITRKRRAPGPGPDKKGPKFPCGICEEGVGSPGIVCCACGSWIHNGKVKQCAGLNGKVVTHADTFRCPKCLESNREIN